MSRFTSSSFGHTNYSSLSVIRSEEEKVWEDAPISASPSPLHDRDPKFWSALAHSLLAMNRLTDSLFNFNRSIEVNGDDSSLWNGRGVCFLHLKKYEQAISDISKAIDLDESVSKYWYSRGLVYMELERYDNAISDFTTAIDLNREMGIYWSERGVCLMKKNNYPEAILNFTKGLGLGTRSTKDRLVRKLRGDCYYENKQYREARHDYEFILNGEETVVLGPLFWYRFGLCQTLIPHQTYKHTYSEFTKAISLGIDIPDCWYQRGKYYQSEFQFRKALDDFRTAARMDQSNDVYWHALADCVLDHPIVDISESSLKEIRLEAVGACTNAIELNDKVSDYWNTRSFFYRQLNMYEEALSDINRALSISSSSSSSSSSPSSSSGGTSPDMDLLLFGRGECYFGLNEYEKAYEDFNKVTSKGHTSSLMFSAHWGMFGECWSKVGKYEEAAAFFTKAIRSSANPSFWHGRGVCNKEMGKDKEAEADMKKATELRAFQEKMKERPVSFPQLPSFGGSFESSSAVDVKKEKEKSGKSPFESAFSMSFSQPPSFGGSFGSPDGEEVKKEKERSEAAPFGDTKNPFESAFSTSFSLPPSFGGSFGSPDGEEVKKEKEKSEAAPFGSGTFSFGAFESAFSTNFPQPSSFGGSFGDSSGVDVKKEKQWSEASPFGSGSTSFGDKKSPFESAFSTSSSQPPSFNNAFGTSPFTTVDTSLVSKLGAVEAWEQEIIDGSASDLHGAFLSIGCRQESYTRMKFWLSHAISVGEGFPINSRRNNYMARKLSIILSIISHGYEVKTWVYDMLENSWTDSTYCAHVAMKESSVDRIRAWLKETSSEETQHHPICSAAYDCFTSISDTVIRFKKCEAVTRLQLIQNMISRRSPLKRIPIDNNAVRSFIVQTLLCGSLKKNRTSPLYGSFFYSGLGEVQLLPIIADYVVGEKKKKKEEEESDGEIEAISSHFKHVVLTEHDDQNIFSLLFDLFLFLTNNTSSDRDCYYKYSKSNIVGPINLLLSLKKKVTLVGSLELYDAETTIDLSFLSSCDTSQLTKIECCGSVLSISPLSKCDLSQLIHLRLEANTSTGILTNLVGLTRRNTASLRTLTVISDDLTDISALKDCDLSCLVELNFRTCYSLSDISCLENGSFPSLKKFVLTNTNVYDISVLSTFKDFLPAFLIFRNCPIEDVSPLSQITFNYYRSQIDLEGTNVCDLSCLEGVSNMSVGSVTVQILSTPLRKAMEEHNNFECDFAGFNVIWYSPNDPELSDSDSDWSEFGSELDSDFD